MGNKVRDMHTAILVGESLMVCSKIVSAGPDLKAVCITNHGCNKNGVVGCLLGLLTRQTMC